MPNLIARRRDITRYIGEDPADVVLYQQAERPGVDDESIVNLVGRIAPASVGVRASQPGGADLRGESPATRMGWVLVLPYDATQPDKGDIVKITNRGTVSVVQKLQVLRCAQYSYKLEVALEEIE